MVRRDPRPALASTPPGWELGSPGSDLPSSLLPGHPNAGAALHRCSGPAPHPRASQCCHRVLHVLGGSTRAVFQRRAHKYFVSNADILIECRVMHFASNRAGGGAAEQRLSPRAAVPAGCWHSSSAPWVPDRGQPACLRHEAAGRGRSPFPGSWVQIPAEPPGDPQQCMGWVHRCDTGCQKGPGWGPCSHAGVGMGCELPGEPQGLPAS